jgi:formylglycine-generating enzyme
MNRALLLGLALTAALLVGGVVVIAAGERSPPARCPAGLVDQGARCCAPGQELEGVACAGTPERCPPGLRPVTSPAPGCAAAAERVRLAAAELRIAPGDWESDNLDRAETVQVAAFELDRTEVTVERWANSGCVASGRCRKLEAREPGIPVSELTAEEAEQFCRSLGGRLPTGAEFLLAAAGPAGARRFPWGPTGLVCRRASYGLVDGPCAHRGGPELAGARPDGRSPEGLHDLAGNVAEWTREKDGGHRARGGSFRSRAAGELKSWASEAAPAAARAAHIGFRCAYPSR